MVKRIQISPDDGTTWYTFPGNTGELTDEASSINDTIFGQEYESSQTGMINWSISANGLYKGFAGYVAKILKSGTPTTFTDEVMELVSGTTYKISDATKNIWDRLTAVVVKDGATTLVEGEDYTLDYLFGRVILDTAPGGTVTVSGKYLPMTQVAKANGFTLTQNANANDNTVYETAQTNGGYQTYEYGLKTVSLSLQGIYAPTNGFRALLAARAEMVIEINPDGSGKSVARGWFKAMSTGQSGDVGDLEQQNLSFSLAVPAQENISIPFRWTFAADTTLSNAIITAINSWQNSTVTKINYLENGTTGVQGGGILTDLSLSGGLNAMNEFTVNIQGSDAPVAFP
jgi:hypothetical protein